MLGVFAEFEAVSSADEPRMVGISARLRPQSGFAQTGPAPTSLAPSQAASTGNAKVALRLDATRRERSELRRAA